MSERYFITGVGAVSPAGWSASDLAAATGGAGSSCSGDVPDPPPALAKSLRSARLRRASGLSRFLLAACREAVGARWGADVPASGVDVLAAIYNGNVSHTVAFYQGVLDDPRQASPILFPETVFNAPASHIAATFAGDGDHLTLLGDSATFLVALARAITRLQSGGAQAVLVAGAEELHPVVERALRTFDSTARLSAGAAAVVVERARRRPHPAAAEVLAISDVQRYAGHSPQAIAESIGASRRQLARYAGDGGALLHGLCGLRLNAAAERRAWSDWPGRRHDLAARLGWAPGAAGGWQVVAACRLLAGPEPPPSVTISADGDAFGALGAVLGGA